MIVSDIQAGNMTWLHEFKAFTEQVWKKEQRLLEGGAKGCFMLV